MAESATKNITNNLYDDNEEFFQGYQRIRKNGHNLKDLLEQPAMRDLLPDLKDKTVLDLGCGGGENCIEFVRYGAKSILGIDVSSKMLDLAKNRYKNEKIEYQQLDLNCLDKIKQKFDLIYSSLVFHYISDYQKLIKNIFNLLNKDGILLFSQEHPIISATIDNNPYWNENTEEVAFTFSNYNQPGIRKVNWIVDNIIMYHRNMSEIVTTLAKNGLFVEIIDEPGPKDFALKKLPILKQEFLIPHYLIIRARKI